MARLTFPDRISTSPNARRSPMPTQLNGREWCTEARTGRARRAKYSTASFWKPYDEIGGGISSTCPSVEGQEVGGLEHHGGREVGHLLEASGVVGFDRGVTRGGDDALVGGQQVVGVGVEVGDPADHGRAGNEVVAFHQQLRHQVDVPGIPFDEVCRHGGRRRTS